MRCMYTRSLYFKRGKQQVSVLLQQQQQLSLLLRELGDLSMAPISLQQQQQQQQQRLSLLLQHFLLFIFVFACFIYKQIQREDLLLSPS